MALTATFGLAAALLLLLAASRRAAGAGGLTEVVRQHGLLPDRLARQAPLGTALEAVAGLAVIIGWLAGLTGVLSVAAAVVAAWYLLLTVYLAVLLEGAALSPAGVSTTRARCRVSRSLVRQYSRPLPQYWHLACRLRQKALVCACCTSGSVPSSSSC